METGDLILHILSESWIKPNQELNSCPWAWHCWIPCLVNSGGLPSLAPGKGSDGQMQERILKKCKFVWRP